MVLTKVKEESQERVWDRIDGINRNYIFTTEITESTKKNKFLDTDFRGWTRIKADQKSKIKMTMQK